MPTLNLTQGKSGIPIKGSGRMYTIENDVDLQAAGAASGDTVQALNVGPKTLVNKVLVEVLRPIVGTSGSATVGDGVDPDGFDTTINLKATAGTVTQTQLGLTEGVPNVLVDAYAAGRIYTAEDTIDLVVTLHADLTDKGKFRVIAVCTDLS